MSTLVPTCPSDCTSLLPQMSFDLCQPDVAFGQIDKIYLTTVDAGGLADFSSLAEWNSRLSNNTSAADDIRYLHVVGSKEVPEYAELDISLKRKVYSPKKHKIMFKIDETNLTNYEFLRTMECSGNYLMWFSWGGDSKYLSGGDDGISVNLKLDLVIPEGTQELAYFQGEASWESKFHPETIANPLA